MKNEQDFRLMELVNGNIVFGAVEAGPDGSVVIKHPFTVQESSIMPYLSNKIGTTINKIIIHPMNILLTVPLEDVETIFPIYLEELEKIANPSKEPEIQIEKPELVL